ncbi:MAG: BREX system ATP-binding domain-containing protein [Thermoplasmata archaeon]
MDAFFSTEGFVTELAFQPKMVGRESEFEKLMEHLDLALEGKGSTVFISGEAGIGKTRLVEELKIVAQSKGFHILSGYSIYESLTPFMPFLEALKSGGLESLFAEEAPRVEGVYLVTDTGLLVKEVVRQETKLNPNIFASMLSTVGNFVGDSLTLERGEKTRDTLNRLGYSDYTILVESGENANLVVVLTGRENEFLIDDMRDTLTKVDRFCGNALKDWDGDEESVHGIDRLLRPFITSGKYDGVYYGREDPKARRNLLFENVSLGLVRQAHANPTLLCIEDLQWADPSTLALMHYVARNATNNGLLIVGTYRSEDLMVKEGETHHLVKEMQKMGREELSEDIELGRLSDDDTVEILDFLPSHVDFSNEFASLIYKESEGNPLFIIELVKLTIEEGILMMDDGTWTKTKGTGEVGIPSGIRDVLVRRLNRVEEKHREVLDVASVIGEEFTSELLTSILDIDRMDLLKLLATLEKNHRLIHSRHRGYKFDHAKIKEVLYSEIPEELRMEYHSVTANSIEKLYKDDLDEVIGDLAFHYYRCRNREKALLYLIRAAEKAKKDYSNEEAIRFYTEALELEEDARERMEIFEGLGYVHDLIGDYDMGLASYERALELTEDKRKRAELLAGKGELQRKRGESEEAMRVLRQALSLVGNKACKEEALVLNVIGHVQEYRGDVDSALESYGRSLEIREKIDDQAGIAGSLNNIGNILLHHADFDRALEYYHRSVEISENIGHLQVLATHLRNIGAVHLHRGDYDLALDYSKRSLEIREKIGDQVGIGLALRIIGRVHKNKGDYDRAFEYIESSLAMEEKMGNQEGISGSLMEIGEVHLGQGNCDRALEWYEKSLAIEEKIGGQRAIDFVLKDIGDAHLGQGDYDRALEYYEKSLAISKTGSQLLPVQTYCGIAEAHFEKRDVEKALDFCKLAFSSSVEIGRKREIAIARRILGKIYREWDMWKESTRNFEESIRSFKEMAIKKELGLAYCEFGLMWDRKGDAEKAREHLDMALEIFEKLKLERETERAREALRDIRA